MHGSASDFISTDGGLPSCATLEEIPFRVREYAALRGLGYSFREIADLFNVTPQAVSLMLTRHRRVVKSLASKSELKGLSARAVNVLARYRVSTRSEARTRNLEQLLKGERNCGRKTLDEIARWMSEGQVPAVTQAAAEEECRSEAIA